MDLSNLVNKVVTLKIITGEEVVALAVDSSGDELLVKTPLLMVMIPDEESGQGMVAFAPWIIGAPETKRIPIRKTSIIAYSEVSKDVATHYAQVTNDPSLTSSAGAVPEMLTASRGGRG